MSSGNNEITLIVEKECSGIRIDKYISEHTDDISRTSIQELLKKESISVNSKYCKANYKVCEGDKIIVNIPKPVELDILPADIPLDIIYEDYDLIIVNKPKGMVVHPGAGHYSDTLVNALLYYYNDQLSSINGLLRPGIVHRIDMDTTGALIVCKNNNAHEHIANQLKEHSITRKYYAIVQGTFSVEQGVIDEPIGRHSVNRKKMAINYKNGKDAITYYKVLKTFSKYSYVECQLETGRTHQIRVHMASINHPVLGDSVYNTNPSPYKLQGQTLHAGVIGFMHPTTNEYMEFTVDLPEYFQKLLNIMP